MFLLNPGVVKAQSSAGEKIESFDSAISIDKNNQAHIKETIVYDYGYNAKRGIYRFVPIRTQAAGMTGEYYYYESAWGKVTQDGKPATILESNNADFNSIRIGDEDITLMGAHTYVIEYTLSPAFEKDPSGGDYFNFNVTGNDWNVPIDKTTASVTTENGSKILDVRCYEGGSGSTSQDCIATKKVKTANFSAADLGVYEGLTINVLAESANYATYLTPQAPPPPDLRPFASLAIGGFALLFGLALRTKSKLKYWARKKDQTIIPQYEPPKDLSVGEIGTLYDNSSDMKEITAMLIDLAVRGYIKITQTSPKSLFKKADYTFDLLKEKSGLTTAETTLLDLILSGSKKTVRLKDVDKTTATSKVEKIKKAFVSELESKGFRLKKFALGSQKIINKIFGLMALAILISGGINIILAAQDNRGLSATIIAAAGGLFTLIIGLALSTRVEISETGYKKWAEIEGLIMYLTVAEKDRLAFHDAPEKNPEHFSHLLPVAIALGVDKQWAKQFKDLDMTQDLNWYNGNTNLNSVILVSSLNRDFSSVVASSLTTPSQSSSGFSGGGFSGGGGGGGGGGSW